MNRGVLFVYASPPTGGAAAKFEARQYRALDHLMGSHQVSSVGDWQENLQGNSTGYKPHDLNWIRQDNQNDLFFPTFYNIIEGFKWSFPPPPSTKGVRGFGLHFRMNFCWGDWIFVWSILDVPPQTLGLLMIPFNIHLQLMWNLITPLLRLATKIFLHHLIPLNHVKNPVDMCRITTGFSKFPNFTSRKTWF